MGQLLDYTAERYWITEGSVWRPPVPITLYDETGAVLGSPWVTTLVMTLYDPDATTLAIINAVEQTSILNTRNCLLSGTGVLTLELGKDDTVIVDATKRYERRILLLEYTWAAGANADAIEVKLIIRNLTRRPYVAP